VSANPRACDFVSNFSGETQLGNGAGGANPQFKILSGEIYTNEASDKMVFSSDLLHESYSKFNPNSYFRNYALKTLPYLTDHYNNAYINIIFKEMIKDVDYNTVTDEIDGTVEQDLTGDTIVAINGGPLDGYIIRVPYTSTFSIDQCHLDVNGNIYDASNNNISDLTLWNGNGYGDDARFNIIDKVKFINDINGNKILIGQKRIKTNRFI